MGGKFGDFIHSLIFSEYLYNSYGITSDVYIADYGDSFLYGPDKAREDLHDLLYRQRYINTFHVYNGQPVHYNLSSFRNSPLLYRSGWTDIYLSYLPEVVSRITDLKFLEAETLDSYSDVVVIHRRPSNLDSYAKSYYEHLIKNNRCIFLTQSVEWYENFPFSNIEVVVPKSLLEIASILNSCKYYIGNQTGITAMAHAVNCNRLVECNNNIDTVHTSQDQKYYTNMSYVIDANNHNISSNHDYTGKL